MSNTPHLIHATDRAVSGASYVGAAVSVATGLTLTEWGVIIGILTAIGTFALNWLYVRRKERREAQRHALEMELLRRRAAGEAL